jgi:methionyl-tRNA formyltransferase
MSKGGNPVRLQVVFMGTPDFAVAALEAILTAGHTVLACYTQPPRPAGRGKALRPSAVALAAAAHGLAVRTPLNFKDPAEVEALRALGADVAVVAAYGLILPRKVLTASRLGCVNIHASLLPRWRGAAPIPRAIMAGDTLTGVTIMQMAAGLDTGDLLLTSETPITAATFAGDLHDALAAQGAALITEALPRLAARTLSATPQPEDGVTYAAKITRKDALIDWTAPAAVIDRQVRALTPYHGVTVTVAGQKLKVLAVEVLSEQTTAPVDAAADVVVGTTIDDALTVACGTGAIRLTRIQRASKAPMDAAALLRGFPVPAGTVLSA